MPDKNEMYEFKIKETNASNFKNEHHEFKI